MHYFDNAATTRVYPEASLRAAHAMNQLYGNPSSLHKMVFRREPALLASREEIDAFCAWWNRMDAHRISPYVNLSGERWFLLFRFQDGTQPAYLRAAVREDSVRAHQQNYRYAAGAFPIAALWERIQSGEPLPAPPQTQESRISVLWFLPAATAAACAACLALRRRKKRRRR